jgi:RimJ/RimL family protein N-acetyltransferase
MVTILSKPEVALPVAVIPQPYTLADALAWIQHSHEDEKRTGSQCFSLWYHATPCLSGVLQLVGNAGIHRTLDTPQSAELGYWLDTSVWGQGIATEVLTALVAHARTTLALTSLVATVALNNRASQRVLEKAGFTQGDTFTLHTVRGEARPSYRYHLLELEGIP